MTAEREAVGDRMTLKLRQRILLEPRFQVEMAVLQIPHQDAPPLQLSTDACAEPFDQCL
jgi:hypothetical protein